MGLRIILGPKSDKKSEYLYKSIEQDVKEYDDVLLFVPSQKRVVEENEYMETLGIDGIINLKITTISEYVKKIIKLINLHSDEKYLSSIDKSIMMCKILSDNKEMIRKYERVRDKEGFVREIINYIDIFRGFNLKNIEDIDKIASLAIQDKNIKQKLKEIMSIYSLYLESIEKNNFLDDTSYINMYLNSNNNCSKVYFDGYNNFKKIELEVIEKYLKNGSDVVISITTDACNISDIENYNTADIFEIPNETYKMLVNMCAKNGFDIEEEFINYDEQKPLDLKELSYGVFLDDKKEVIESKNINLSLVSNEKKEVEEVANKILDSIKIGEKFSDNAIYITDVESYSNIIKQVFYEYKIPFHIDENYNVSNNILFKYVSNILNLAVKKDDAKQMIKTLKLGLANIDQNELRKLENYIIEFNVYSLYKALNYTSSYGYDISDLNNLRIKILESFDLDIDVNQKETVKYFVEKLYKNLEKNEILENFLCKLREEKNIKKQEVMAQIIPKLNEIFDSIYKIYGDEKIEFKKFLNIFEISVGQQCIKTIPEEQNQVMVLDINKSKTGKKRNIYILGANEGELPKNPSEDIIFSDIELEELEDVGLKLKEKSDTKYNMGMFNVYEAFNTASNHMYIYIKSSNMSGKSLIKSRIIDKIQESINVKIDEKVIQETKKKENLTKANMLENLSLDSKDISKEEILGIWEYLKNDPFFLNVIEWKKVADKLSSYTTDLIYSTSGKVRFSITRLETFKKCPFSYYLKYILNIKKREEFEVTSLDLGSFMHGVIEEFSKYLFENNISWRNLNDASEFEKIEFKIDDIINKKLGQILSKQKESIRYKVLKEKLIITLKQVIKIISKSFSQSEFLPLGYEMEFSDSGVFAPIVLRLSDGRKIELIGKIDRVDTMKLDDRLYVRVIDYKSSNRDITLEDIKDGISLQLLTYLSAIIQNMKEKGEKYVIPAAMNYFTLSEKMLHLDKSFGEDEIKNKIIEKYRLKGIFLKDIEVLNKMDNRFDTNERLIDVSKMSYSRNSKKLLEEKEYEEMCIKIRDILKSISEEIINGVVSISPNKKCDSCKYCDFSTICRKDIKV